jgi:hypothetical protein
MFRKIWEVELDSFFQIKTFNLNTEVVSFCELLFAIVCVVFRDVYVHTVLADTFIMSFGIVTSFTD